MDGTIPLVVSFLAPATGNPDAHVLCSFSTLASFGNADEDGGREYKG